MSSLGSQVPKFIAKPSCNTLSQRNKQFYGTTGLKYRDLIQAANKVIIKDVNKIDVGQVFKITVLPEELKNK